MDDKLAQLKQLGELKTRGLLSDAEFEQQKARILDA
jgi:Short C-terminal domain